MNWEILTSEKQFMDLISSNSLFAVFKHSTRCSTSTMVKNRIERDWRLEFPIYYLDLLNYRSISSLISTESGIEHQSPQLIAFKDGQPFYNASHTSIMINDLKEEFSTKINLN